MNAQSAQALLTAVQRTGEELSAQLDSPQERGNKKVSLYSKFHFFFKCFLTVSPISAVHVALLALAVVAAAVGPLDDASGAAGLAVAVAVPVSMVSHRGLGLLKVWKCFPSIPDGFKTYKTTVPHCTLIQRAELVLAKDSSSDWLSDSRVIQGNLLLECVQTPLQCFL